MICKIVLSNFMAHTKTELELADGLTVLVGPNNIGKSTVAVALKILARNSNSNFVMQHELQPILLGDIFDKPRDNPNWLISRMLDIFEGQCIPTIVGNHDCENPHLDENDSLTILAKAGAIRLLDQQHLWASGRTAAD